ncbi:MAG: hypothetical protein IJ928_03515 [Prevotella sp.]|nr:hypothetical protein [Prevotella sp.]
MKKLLIFAIGAVVLMAGCKNQGQAKAAGPENGDTITVGDNDVAAVENDTTPMPMFLCYFDKEHMQVPYWSVFEEPQKSDDNDEYFDNYHQSWKLQADFRRRASLYTKLLLDQKTMVDVKFIGEQLKTPDGEDADIGIIHSRPGIPTQGAKYAFADEKEKLSDGDGTFFLLVAESYLKSRKQLECTSGEEGKPFPPSVVQQLEKQYDMQASRSLTFVRIGNRYGYGIVQFKPKDKSVWAVEVVTDGDKVYSFPVKGWYDSDTDFGWNVDDEGEYNISFIDAAFEGPNGLELFYTRGCVESCSVGMFLLRDGKLIRQEYAVFQANIPDEMTPLWKTYARQMQKLYVEQDPNVNKDYELNRYYAADFDGDGCDEYWLRDKDDRHGALFTCKNGKIALIGVEDGRRQAQLHRMKGGNGFVSISGPAGGPSYSYEVYELRDSRVVHTFTAMQVNGKMDACSMDGKPYDKAKGSAYLKSLPQETDYYVYFVNAEEN